MNDFDKPCVGCKVKPCPREGCWQWQEWFCRRWEDVNRYAWDQMDRLGRREPRGFLYGLPHEYRDPCEKCPCAAWCDTPCARRLKWWDFRMAQLRRRAMLSAEC